jgi:SAM-dependent methyltransferase
VNTAEYARMFEAEDAQWWYAGMRALSFALLDPALPAAGERPRLLDAGCGTGGNLVRLAERGRALGVDVSVDALSLARTRGVDVARASLLALPFPDGAFDVVTCFDVLYHRWVADDLAATRELVRVLRPGGLLLVRVPALRLLWGAHDEAVHSRARYTRAELRRLLAAAGLVVRRATYCNTILFPLVAARRLLDRVTGRQGSDVAFLPAPLERLFRGALAVEERAVRVLSLPLGTSVVALGQRPETASVEGPGRMAR